MVTTFSLMLKLRVEGFSECLPYKVPEALGFIPSPMADWGQGERKEWKEGMKEERGGGRDLYLRGLKSETKFRSPRILILLSAFRNTGRIFFKS